MTKRPDVAAPPACILIVDDERQNRELLEVMLAPEGYRLVTATSGAEALERVAHEAPDLILLDIMMPGMDGYQVAARIKADAATRDIPVVMLTALDDRSSRIHGLSVGAVEFLTKPLNRTELCERVKALLRVA